MSWFYSFITLASHIIVPIWFIFWIFRERQSPWLRWISIVSLSSSFIGLMYLAGAAWDWVGTFWPNIFLIVLPLVILIIGSRRKNLDFLPAKKLQAWAPIILFFGFSYSLFSSYPQILSARHFDQTQAVALKFPLKNGTYFVRQGGSALTTNHHFAIPAQKFALDIVKLNSAQLRASGLMPSDNDRYAIFAENLYAPCDGEVLATRGELVDLTPMNFDEKNILGNFITLYCGDHTILMAHLKQNSVKIKAGDRVAEGQEIAQVGNTGNTSEPHLHLQALRGRIVLEEAIIGTGPGVPMTFNERFLIRGDKISDQ